MASQQQLGALLMEMGFIDKGQLESALDVQHTTHKRLGKILVEAGVITEDRLVHALSRQLGVEACDPIMTPVHEKVLAMLPSSVAFAHRVLPIARQRDGDLEVLYVATADPMDNEAAKAVRKAVGRLVSVRWMLVGETEMDLALARHYGKAASQPGGPPGVIQGSPVGLPPRVPGAKVSGVASTQDLFGALSGVHPLVPAASGEVTFLDPASEDLGLPKLSSADLPQEPVLLTQQVSENLPLLPSGQVEAIEEADLEELLSGDLDNTHESDVPPPVVGGSPASAGYWGPQPSPDEDETPWAAERYPVDADSGSLAAAAQAVTSASLKHITGDVSAEFDIEDTNNQAALREGLDGLADLSEEIPQADPELAQLGWSQLSTPEPFPPVSSEVDALLSAPEDVPVDADPTIPPVSQDLELPEEPPQQPRPSVATDDLADPCKEARRAMTHVVQGIGTPEEERLVMQLTALLLLSQDDPVLLKALQSLKKYR